MTANDICVCFAIRIIGKIVGSGIPVNGKAYACRMPNGQFYISKTGTVGAPYQGRVCCTNGVEGVNFKRI